MSTPQIQRDGDNWVLTWDEHGIGMGFEALKESSSALKARVTVESRLAGRVVGPVNIDLLGMRSQAEFANGCAERVNGLEKPVWRALVVQAFSIVAKQFSDPGPTLDLSEVDATEPVEYLIPGLVPLSETTVMYGDGESAKSLLALRIAFSVALGHELPWGGVPKVGNVLYLDWETNGATIAKRLRRVALGEACLPPRIHYRECRRSLIDELPTIKEEISRRRIDLVIVDSLGYAASGALVEDETARSAMNAMRNLSPVTRLAVAHISRANADATGGKTRPFGSAFFWNGMRSGFEVRRSEEASTDNMIDLGIFHWKSNDGRHVKPFGLSVLFDTKGDGILFEESSIDESPDLAAHTPIAQRIRNMLRKTPGNTATSHMMSEQLDIPENVIRTTLGRMQGVVRISEGGGRGKTALWGLEA